MTKKTKLNDSSENADTLKVRLDKWLWAARFYKTRAIAREMVQGGKVHYNGQRSKASKIVEIGAVIKLAQGVDEKTITVLNILEKRQSAPIAQTMYQGGRSSWFYFNS